MPLQATKQVFSVIAGQVTEHTIEKVQAPGGFAEWVLTCTQTGHAIKFPADMNEEEIDAKIATHNAANENQIVVPTE